MQEKYRVGRFFKKIIDFRRYLMTKYDSRKADEAYRQVMNFLKFNKFFNESLMTPVPMKN